MVRVVILMQENKTPDFYFPTLASWGANIENRGNLLTSPPLPDPPHDRNAWVHSRWKLRPDGVADRQRRALPLYSWLAKQFTYCDYHFAFGTNSTPGHMPRRRRPDADAAQSALRDFTGVGPAYHLQACRGRRPHVGRVYRKRSISLEVLQELADAASRKNIHTSTQPSNDTFTAMAAQGLCLTSVSCGVLRATTSTPPDRTRILST